MTNLRSVGHVRRCTASGLCMHVGLTSVPPHPPPRRPVMSGKPRSKQTIAQADLSLSQSKTSHGAMPSGAAAQDAPISTELVDEEQPLLVRSCILVVTTSAVLNIRDRFSLLDASQLLACRRSLQKCCYGQFQA